MSMLPPDSNSDDLDLFGHFLEHQQTDEFQIEVDLQLERQRAAQRPAIAAGARRYRKNHPDLINLRQQSVQHKPYLYARQNGLCHWCGMALPKSYDIDHIVPLIKGGTNDLKNLCVCHIRCNRQKGAKTDWKPSHRR